MFHCYIEHLWMELVQLELFLQHDFLEVELPDKRMYTLQVLIVLRISSMKCMNLLKFFPSYF